MPLSDSRREKQREARALLEGFWPEAFSFDDPRPLKVGIFNDLASDAERRVLPFDADIIKPALKVYTCRYVYQKALSRQDCRVDLEGNPAGEVSVEQRDHASAQVKRIEAKAKARKEAFDAEKAASAAAIQPDA